MNWLDRIRARFTSDERSLDGFCEKDSQGRDASALAGMIGKEKKNAISFFNEKGERVSFEEYMAKQANIDELKTQIRALQQKCGELQKSTTTLENFVGYLLDNCEGEIIYEESLQQWLASSIKLHKAELENNERAEGES